MYQNIFFYFPKNHSQFIRIPCWNLWMDFQKKCINVVHLRIWLKVNTNCHDVGRVIQISTNYSDLALNYNNWYKPYIMAPSELYSCIFTLKSKLNKNYFKDHNTLFGKYIVKIKSIDEFLLQLLVNQYKYEVR